ncbi:MAG: hypothetical protein U1E45_10740 [Geminicoccaceae bacterium]
MSTQSLTLHRSPSGDRWLLAPWPDSSKYRVVHVRNDRSGGHISTYQVDDFLAQDSHAPEVQALMKLVRNWPKVAE